MKDLLPDHDIVTPATTTDAKRHEVVKVRGSICSEGAHASEILTKEGLEIKSEDAISMINAGVIFFMIPPPGAPAYPAYVATGLPLLLQIKHCKGCDKDVLFA